MISHIFLGITDHIRAHDFYSAIMDELGYVLKFRYPEKSWSGWVEKGTSRPIVGIGKPYNGEPMSVGNGQMLALLAKNRAMVDATYAKAIALGATCEGAPGLRPHYHPNYYGAYFRDLDGNEFWLARDLAPLLEYQDWRNFVQVVEKAKVACATICASN